MPFESALLERDREIEQLRDVLDDVRHSASGRVVLVEGEPGIGKTRLLRQLRSMATASGLGVLSGRGSVLEQSFGYGVVRQLLERAWRTAEHSVHEVRQVFQPAAADSCDSGELARLHGLYWLTADLCARPTVVLVDDAQWCDPESLRFIEYLRPRLDDLPILLAMVLRLGEPVPGAVLESLTADPDVVSVRPRALSADASRTLLQSLLGRSVDGEFAAASASVTSGNPFLITVLAGSIAREGLDPSAASLDRVFQLGTEAIQRQIGRRLDRMRPTVRRMAEAAAALGPDAPMNLVAAGAGIDALSAADAAGELAEWTLIDVQPGPFGLIAYRHPVAADAVLGLLAERDRQHLRHRCADVLERHGAEAERVAAQLLDISPGIDPAATRRLSAAADAAARRGAPSSALTYLRRCLAEDLSPEQRSRVLEEAGTLALQTDLDTAVLLLEEAVGLPSGREDPDLWARLGLAYGYLRHPEPAVHAMERALRLLPAEEDDRRRAWEASLLVGATVVTGRRDLAARLHRLQGLPPACTLGARMLDAALALHEMARADAHGAGRARDALSDGTLVRHANGEGPLVCGWLTLIAADDPLALTSLDDAVREAHAHGSLRALAASITFRALARLRAGRLVDAVEDAEVALGHAFSSSVDLDPRFAGAYLADALLACGDYRRAEEVLESVNGFRAGELGPRYVAREAAARLRRMQGRAEEALEIALDAGRCWAEYGFDNPGLGGWRSEAALAAHAGGDAAQAVTLAREEVRLARSWAAPGALGRSLRVLGLVLGGAQGLHLLEESVGVLDGTVARLEHARSLAALGAALRRAGRRSDAHTVLAGALDLADLCGASGLSTEVAAELRTAGFRPRRRRLAGVASLTLSERRVADLAATGATNRSIAKTLFVTTKTVELHLTNVYRKLDVAGRQQLRDALAASE